MLKAGTEKWGFMLVIQGLNGSRDGGSASCCGDCGYHCGDGEGRLALVREKGVGVCGKRDDEGSFLVRKGWVGSSIVKRERVMVEISMKDRYYSNKLAIRKKHA